MKTCFICNKKLKPSESSHIISCAKNNNTLLSKENIKIKQIQHQNKKIVLEYENIFDLYVNKNYTYTMFKKHFSITSKQLDFILEYFDIPKRNKNISNKLRNESYIKTVKEKYGVDSTNSLNEVKIKKKNSNLKNYGVENVFQNEYIIQKSINTKIKKYGTAGLAFKNKTEYEKYKMLQKTWDGGEVWRNNLTSIEKEKIINNLVQGRREWFNNLSPEEELEYLKKRNSFISKLEDRVYEVIKSMNPKRQYWIDRNSYDFKINKNIILEINGDYWHANPNKYKSDDKILYPKEGFKTAESIWQRDKIKKEKAEKYGYKVFYLWEDEMKKMTDNDILNYIKNLK